jgi:hypothetical protein
MPDVADPRVYLVGAAAILDEYPQAVRDAIADPRSGTRLLKPFPSLHDLRAACDVAYEPIERDLMRTRARSKNLTLPAPSKPDEATRDAQVEDYETRIKPMLRSALTKIAPDPNERQRPPDGRHYDRIKADLEARRARSELESTTGPPDP